MNEESPAGKARRTIVLVGAIYLGALLAAGLTWGLSTAGDESVLSIAFLIGVALVLVALAASPLRARRGSSFGITAGLAAACIACAGAALWFVGGMLFWPTVVALASAAVAGPDWSVARAGALFAFLGVAPTTVLVAFLVLA